MTEPTLKEKFHSDGSIAWQTWWLNGKCHNVNGPARIGYYPDGSIKWQQWWLNGKHHRNDGPARIGYHQILDEQNSTKSCGSIECQSWWLNAKRHREDGPSVVRYRLDGSIWWQEWNLNGKCHRSDGPAYIKYHSDGSIHWQSWFLNGAKLTEEEFQQQKRKIANKRKVLLLQSRFSAYNDFEKWLIPEIVNLI